MFFQLFLQAFWRTKQKLFITLFSLIIGTASVTVVHTIIGQLEVYVQTQSAELLAGDIQVRHTMPLHDEPLAQELLQNNHQISFQTETNSLVRTDSSDTDASLLAALKIVSDSYPLSGELLLASGKEYLPLRDTEILVDQSVLDRLNTQVGESLHIGSELFRIQDVIEKEPDKSMNIFSFGDRILMSERAFERTKIDRTGSRITYTLSIVRHDSISLDELETFLKKSLNKSSARITTKAEGPRSINRIMETLQRYFFSITILIIFLVVIAIHLDLNHFIRENLHMITVCKCFGLKTRTSLQFFSLFLGGIGILAGILSIILVFFMLFVLSPLLENIFSIPFSTHISFWDIFFSISFSVYLCMVSALIPFGRLQKIPPLQIIRKTFWEREIHKHFPQELFFASVSAFALAILFFVFTQSIQATLLSILMLVAAFGILFLSFYAFSSFLHRRKSTIQSFHIRSILSYIKRPGSTLPLIITSLSFAFSSLCILLFLQTNITENLNLNMKQKSPELILLDIQKDQVEPIQQIIGKNSQMYPVIRGRIYSIDGEVLQNESRRRNGEIGRPFNLTYRTDMIKGETLSEGTWWETDTAQQEVSVEKIRAQNFGITLGSVIEFDIQGVLIPVTVTSLREVETTQFQPYFYFVTPPPVLAEAPHTFFAFLHLDTSQVASVQNILAKEFPNISTIDAAHVFATLEQLTRTMGSIVLFLAQGAFFLGILMLLGVLILTASERKHDCMLMKIFGAKKSFLWKGYLLEIISYLFLSFLFALLFAVFTVWILNIYVFEFERFYWNGQIVWIFLGSLLLILLVGIRLMKQVFHIHPMEYFRKR